MVKTPTDVFNKSPAQSPAYSPGRAAGRPAGSQGSTSSLRRPLARVEKLMGISTRLHLPVASQTASSGREVLYSSVQIGFPAWAGVTDWRVAFPWFYGDENPGGNPPEVDIANAGSVYASIGISGVFTMGNFDGDAQGVMTPNTWGRWCKLGNPVYTPSATGKIRSACVVATSALRPVGYSRQSNNSEAWEWSASLDLTKIQTGGTVTHNAAITYGYGPCLMIGKGNDGRMVPIILGNSIDFSNDETPSLSDTRGNMGFWQRGFDDAANALPYINFAVSGSRFGQQASLAAGAFRRRGEILNSIETGCPADLAVGGNENEGLNDSVEWRRVIDAMADFINQTFGMPFAHRTMLPKVSYSGNNFGNTLGAQTAQVDGRLAVNTSLVSTPAQFPTFQLGEAYHDVGTPGKWKVPAFTTTVASAYAGSGAISLNASPPLGTNLVFNAGLAGVALRTVTAVSGAGPFNVTCSVVPPVQNLNDPVAASSTDGDGTHPSTAENIARGQPVVITGKANFR